MTSLKGSMARFKKFTSFRRNWSHLRCIFSLRFYTTVSFIKHVHSNFLRQTSPIFPKFIGRPSFFKFAAVLKCAFYFPSCSSALSRRPLSGTDTLKKVVSECPGLIKPELIHSQRLRKYLETTVQV